MKFADAKDIATRLQITNKFSDVEIENLVRTHGQNMRALVHRLVVIKIIESGEPLYQGMAVNHVRFVADVVAEAYMLHFIGVIPTTDDFVLNAAKVCRSATFEIGYLYSEQIRTLVGLLVNGRRLQESIVNTNFMKD